MKVSSLGFGGSQFTDQQIADIFTWRLLKNILQPGHSGSLVCIVIDNYGVFFSTKKCALYFKKCNFVFVS